MIMPGGPCGCSNMTLLKSEETLFRIHRPEREPSCPQVSFGFSAMSIESNRKQQLVRARGPKHRTEGNDAGKSARAKRRKKMSFDIENTARAKRRSKHFIQNLEKLPARSAE